MLEVQNLRGFSDEQAYRKWHMGPGMVIATLKPEEVMAKAEAQGVIAKELGQLTVNPGIIIKNRGAVQAKEWLTIENSLL